jgi:hypothetical protein
MNLSIIIVNWNTRDLLRGCLASLPSATAGLQSEIIVVDNASADGSAEMVASDFPTVRLLESGGNLGFSRGNNLALPHASGQAILLLNPDTVCPPQSLTRLYRFLQGKPQAAVTGPRLTDAHGQPTISGGWFPRLRDHWLGCLDPRRLVFRGRLAERIVFVPGRSEPSRPVAYIMGACFMMSRAALETIGPLDDRFFMYFEETDWCLRAQQAGLEVWYCAETEITHLESQAAGSVTDFSLRQFQQSYRLFVAKHHGPRRVWAFRLAQFAEYGTKSLLRRLARGEHNRALADHFAAKAHLQLRGTLDVAPPA